VSLKSTYIRYTGFDLTDLTVGNFKEPYSLINLTSSSDTTFMERAAPAKLFSPGRNIGVEAHSHGEHAGLADARWTATLGLFSNGDNDGGREDEGWAVTGRTTVAPPLGDRGFVHLGAALSHREFKDTKTLRLRERPESHVTSTRLVDSGDLQVDRGLLYGAEVAIVYGAFSVQGEYLGSRFTRRGPDLGFRGGYAFASWILTGESRRYDGKRGIFRGVEPKKSLGDGGYGAWELAVRYSALDLSDADVVGGEMEILTLGLSWYLNRNLRLTANYNDVLGVDRPGSALDDVAPEIFQLRAQGG
jgi:phosphate-selective porin OprO/OprP